MPAWNWSEGFDTHCARVPRKKTGSVQIAEPFQQIVTRHGRVGIGKYFEPTSKFQRPDNDLIGLFITQQIKVV